MYLQAGLGQYMRRSYIYHGSHVFDMCIYLPVLFANKRITRTVTMATIHVMLPGSFFTRLFHNCCF